ncbi:MAG: NPXTG-anchored protein [Acetanaerobacterium sp.]
MKKLIAMVLTFVMMLSLAAVVSAADITGDIIGTVPGSSYFPTMLEFDEDAVIVDIAAGGNFEEWNGEESISVASSDNNKLAVSYKKEIATDGKILYSVKLDPQKTVTAEEHNVTVTIALAQITSEGDKVKGSMTQVVTMYNARHYEDDLIPLADDTYKLNASKPVIDAEVFVKVADEDEQKLSINYASYSVVFPKVSKQDTSLYLSASTTVPDYISKIADGQDVKYINFPGNPYLKDAAKISVNFNNDWQNENGTTAYVYAVQDDVLIGEPIVATIENGAIVFETSGRLGEYAIFATKMSSIIDAQNDTGSTANPDTGDSNTFAIAIVFATLALAGAGFVAVKKATR